MRLAVIACRIFTRELSRLVSESDNICYIYWLEQGLHNTPELLRKKLQQQINAIETEQEDDTLHRKFDAIVLAYGLCSNGIIGISSKSLPIVAPRCDDCIALFLGSQNRYLDLFHSKNGIYWYNDGWIEIGSVPSQEHYRQLLQEYTEQYGEDNAQYLLDVELTSLKKYESCIYIKSSAYWNEKNWQLTNEAADYFKWNLTKVDGDSSYLKALLSGNWDSDRFLICPKGKTIGLTFDKGNNTNYIIES